MLVLLARFKQTLVLATDCATKLPVAPKEEPAIGLIWLFVKVLLLTVEKILELSLACKKIPVD